MSPREELLQDLWSHINAPMQDHLIDGYASSEMDPNEPFGDIGPALLRLLELGADRRDIALVQRHASYQMAFSTLYVLDGSGIDFGEFRGLHESILSADPSGLEGRPGSAPRKKLEPIPELERTLSEAGIHVRVLDIYPSAKKVRLYGTPSQLEAARSYFATQEPPMEVITVLGTKWETVLGSQPAEPDAQADATPD